MQPNEVQVGHPRTIESQIVQPRFLRPDRGQPPQLIEERRPVTRTVGVRIMHADMLGRICRWLDARGQPLSAASLYVSGWMNPGSFQLPDRPTVIGLAEVLEQARRGPGFTWRQRAYLEAAAFCVRAWLA